ncbi:XTP/dITP diphosphatase [Aminicella lysinilytica]|uniref:dITP/XTP pyrophosphatase n=1 Tax=Aminicella lysinilytica TaxID=433323 RepID=A0A4R6PWT2_9FIRM|nr:XTP/dITP diphosphatase [Aminicella lysinilytica]TDP47384.1 XTP/dITP diphosphohydrolase [Aminicella lysinilytica]
MDVIIAATKNANKIKEMDAITSELGMHIISRDEAGVPDVEIVEDGETFEENSYKKAYEIMKLSGRKSIADDSGLEVDYLNGAPGVYSARFAGEDCNDKKNNKKLLSLLEDVPYKERRARFVSVITLIYPNGEKLVARGECEGHILMEPLGLNGFGYDPIFVPKGFQRTFAQLTAEEKNHVSHRAKALKKLAEMLKEKE